MSVTFRRLGTSELLPRYLFAESLYTRRRVLEVGAVAATHGESARFLLEHGARSVLACDTDLAAVEAAHKGLGSSSLRFRPLVFDDLESGSFDVVLVADLGAYVGSPQVLAELARLLARGGCLLGGLRNPAGLALWQLMEPEEGAPPTYGQLLDVLSPHFAHIAVATQSPVVGYQLAFESLEELQIDGSLAGAGEAAYYMVVAGREPVAPLAAAWVQLPPEPLAFNRGRMDEAAARAKRWEERSESLREALGRLRAELTEREAQVGRLVPALEAAREEVARLTVRLEKVGGGGELAHDRDELAARLRRTELELQVAAERLADGERRLGQQRLEVEAAQRARAEAEVQALAVQEALRLERARREELSTSLEEARERLTQAYGVMRQVQEELAGLAMARERDRQEAERARQHAAELRQVVEAARERELRLADQYSAALAALEHLKAEVARVEEAREAARQVLQVREAELARVLRELESMARRSAALESGRQETELQATAREAELRGLETELASARSRVEQLTVQLEARTRGEAQARATAAQLEQRLHEAQAQLETLARWSQAQQEQLQQAQAQSAQQDVELLQAELEAERQRRELVRQELTRVQAKWEVEKLERRWTEEYLLQAWVQAEDERHKQAELNKELLRLHAELESVKQDRHKAEAALTHVLSEVEALRTRSAG
jgi:chromosome segregation ATPase